MPASSFNAIFCFKRLYSELDSSLKVSFSANCLGKAHSLKIHSSGILKHDLDMGIKSESRKNSSNDLLKGNIEGQREGGIGIIFRIAEGR